MDDKEQIDSNNMDSDEDYWALELYLSQNESDETEITEQFIENWISKHAIAENV